MSTLGYALVALVVAGLAFVVVATRRGWQLMTAPPELEEVHLRLRRTT